MNRIIDNKLLPVFLVLLLCAPLAAQTPLPVAAPEAVGMSSERLKRVDQLIERKIEQEKMVTAVTLVARQGKLVHFESFGKSDVEANTLIKKDAIFRIYSMTKPITTVAAMMLYEEGKFQLSDPVHWYLPELKDVKVYSDGELVKPRRPMSVRDLMSHKSGLTYGIFGNSMVDQKYREADILNKSGTLKDMVDKLSELPLAYHPGEQWQYSVSTDVLAYLVEVLSGKPLDEFFRERTFAPLQMDDTGFHVPEEKLSRFPVNYRWNGQGKRSVADHPSKSSYRTQPTFFSGGGGLVSTSHDYARFCQMLLNGGELDGARILSAKSIQIMTSNHLDDATAPSTGVTLGSGAGFGLGFRVITDVPRNQRLVSQGTYSWGGMASTFFFIDPREDLFAVLMTQKFPTDLRIRDEFQTAVYQSIVQLSDTP